MDRNQMQRPFEDVSSDQSSTHSSPLTSPSQPFVVRVLYLRVTVRLFNEFPQEHRYGWECPNNRLQFGQHFMHQSTCFNMLRGTHDP